MLMPEAAKFEDFRVARTGAAEVTPAPKPPERAAALRVARQSLPQGSPWPLPHRQMDRDGGHARHLLPRAVDSLGSGALSPRSGGAHRFPVAALLLLLPRNLAAGILLHHRPARARRAGAVSGHLDRRTGVVRLHLSADGVDRSDDRGRALLAGRPQPAAQARQGTVVGRDACRARAPPISLGS